MKRHHQILAAVLVLQIILGVVTFWPRSATAKKSQPIFPNIAPDNVVSLTITHENGESVTLRRDGEGWVLASGGDYPAEADKVNSLVEKILGLNTMTMVANTPASHKRLRVTPDNFVRRIDFETDNGNHYTIYIGSAQRYTGTHFRLDGMDATYMTTELASWDLNTSATSWVDTQYFKVESDSLEEVTLKNAHGTFTFVKDDEGKWTLADLAEDEKVSLGKIGTAIRNASSITLLRPLGKEEKPEYGMDDPNAVVTLKTKDGSLYTVTVGAQGPEDTSYVVKSSESPFYVRVSEFNVKSLVNNTREDFLQTPTPTPTPTP